MTTAAQKLKSILGEVVRNAEMMQTIAKASKEQAQAIDEVGTSVRLMDEMTQHNAALVEQTNAAIEQTEAQASELDRVVDVFTIVEGQAAPVVQRRSEPRRAAPVYQAQGNAAIAEDWDEF